MITNKLIILDRDGVINIDTLDGYVTCPAEWQPIPGSLEAMAKLTQAGYHIAVASNQAGVAKGLYTKKNVEMIHTKMQALCNDFGTKIDFITYCPHQSSDQCNCRKPKPGMLLEIADHLQIGLENVAFVGDKLTDIQAAQNAGCLPIMVLTGHGQLDYEKHKDALSKISIYDDLHAYVTSLLTSS